MHNNNNVLLHTTILRIKINYIHDIIHIINNIIMKQRIMLNEESNMYM